MCKPFDFMEPVRQFEQYLLNEEKSTATIQKYLRDIRCFASFLAEQEICKEKTVAYKAYLTEIYAPASVNSMLIALNRFLKFIGMEDCCVRLLKIQRQIYSSEDQELTREEYVRLVNAARQKGNERLNLILQTICGTGIRVSELRYITAEAVQEGRAVVNCKNKMRVIFIPAAIQKLLKPYMKKSGITAGAVFITKSGKPLNRSNIWRDMKNLCKQAGSIPKKVYPHSLRHLFARTFYRVEKDLVRLADLLGHSSVNTTRIYTMETGNEHRIRLERVEKLLMT